MNKHGSCAGQGAYVFGKRVRHPKAPARRGPQRQAGRWGVFDVCTGRKLATKQIVVVEPSAQHNHPFFGIRVRVFNEDTWHRLRPAGLQRGQFLPVVVEEVTNSGLVPVIRVTNNALIDQIRVNRPLLPIV